MAFQKTYELRGPGAQFKTEALQVTFLGDTFSLTEVYIDPIAENVLHMRATGSELEGHLIIDKDES